MRFTLIAIIIIFSLSIDLYAQKRDMAYSGFFKDFYYRGPFSITAGSGLSAYNGDLCGRPQCNTFKLAYNIGANYKLWPHLAVGAEINYFKLKARSVAPRDALEFSSTNADLRIFLRYYLIDDIITSYSRTIRRKVKPYAQLGLAGIYYNPKSHFVSDITKTAVMTEGRTYPAFTQGFTAGLGFCFTFSSRLSLLAEGMYVFTLSDYLDDAGALRGKANGLPDGYGIASLKLQVSPFVKK